jgi:hypothetical protein
MMMIMMMGVQGILLIMVIMKKRRSLLLLLMVMIFLIGYGWEVLQLSRRLRNGQVGEKLRKVEKWCSLTSLIGK